MIYWEIASRMLMGKVGKYKLILFENEQKPSKPKLLSLLH